jgi:hypothetical protein
MSDNVDLMFLLPFLIIKLWASRSAGRTRFAEATDIARSLSTKIDTNWTETAKQFAQHNILSSFDRAKAYTLAGVLPGDVDSDKYVFIIVHKECDALSSLLLLDGKVEGFGVRVAATHPHCFIRKTVARDAFEDAMKGGKDSLKR